MPVSVTLEATSSRRLVLSHYAPGEECRPHRHDALQISVLLAGGYVEETDQGRAYAEGPSLSRKPGGFEHQNRFGEAGALILSLNVDAPSAIDPYFIAGGAKGLGPGALHRMADDATTMASLAGEIPRACRTAAAPPRFGLLEARDRLLAGPQLSIATLSRSFGLHPVQFARLFREAFAQSPTAARQNRRNARAIGRLLLTPTPLAEIAAAEGFADQAHFSRAISQTTGWSPGRLRRLFAEV